MQQRFVGLLIPFSTILIIALIAVFWMIPNVQEYRRVITDTDLAQRELEQTLIPQRDALAQVDDGEVTEILTELDSVIPMQIDPGLVLGILEEISNQHDVSLTQQTFVRRNGTAQMLEFSFKLYGTSENINSFFLDLENIRPILYVIQMSTTAEVDEDENTFMNTNVLIQSPYGVPGVVNDGVLSQTVTENDRQVLSELKERFNYFTTDLYYKTHDPFSLGKEDPFIE